MPRRKLLPIDTDPEVARAFFVHLYGKVQGAKSFDAWMRFMGNDDLQARRTKRVGKRKRRG